MSASEKAYQLINACFESLDKAGELLSADPELIHERDGVGETALHYLVIENQLEAVRFLVKYRADINTQDDFKVTPLAHAAQCGYEKMVEYLLSQGADVNLADENEDTPIHHAISGNNPQIVLMLIKRSADVNSVNDLKETPLHLAMQEDDRVEVAKVLIEKGANIEAKEMVDETPLHKAAFWGSLKQCEFLVSCGANPKAKSANGDTPSDIAEKHGHSEVVKLFNSVGGN